MRRRPGLIALLLAGAGLLAVVVFIALRGQPGDEQAPRPAPTPDEPEEAQGPIQVRGSELTVREDGEVVWRASFGGEITLDREAGTAHAQDVAWRFEGEGFDDLSLRAPLMVADYDAGWLRFSEGVAIEAEGAMSFSAGEVQYDFDARTLLGIGGVRFARGRFEAEAEQFVIDNRARQIRLKRGELTRR